MRQAFTIAWKDLRSIYRQRSSIAMMLVAPLALTALIGSAFGGSSGWQFGAVKTALVNLDAGGQGKTGGVVAPSTQKTGGATAPPSKPATSPADPAAALVGILRSPELRDLLAITMYENAAAARRAVDDGEQLVAVIVPQGFGAAATGSGGERSSVEVYSDPTQEIGPAVVRAIVQQAVDEFNAARAAAVAAAKLAAGDAPAIDPSQLQATIAGVAGRAAQLYAAAPAASALAIEERSPQVGAGTTEPGVTGLVLSGMMVFFLFFGAATASRTILQEQNEGTLQRLFTTPATRSAVLGGKFLTSFLTVIVQSAVILLFGWLVFRIAWGASGPVLALVIAGCAVAAGLALLVTSLARTMAQQGAIGSGVYLVLALLGGNFTGTASLSGPMATLRLLTPNGWLLQGWDTTMRGGSVADIVPQLLVSLAFAVVFFAAAVLIMRRRFAT